MRALLIRDLRLAFRAGGGFGLSLGFYLTFCLFIALSLGPDPSALAGLAPGLLWLGALLSSLLTLDRLFALDAEDGSLELLAISPLPLEGAFLAKAGAHWLVTGLPLTLAAPVFGLFLALPMAGVWPLVLSLALGTPALSLCGAFGAALTVGVRRGGLLMSLIVLPLYVPVLIYGAEAARRGALGADPATPLALLVAITLLSMALLPFAGAAVIRMNLR